MSKTQQTRETSLDILKGVAVLTMISTHVIAFHHDFSDPGLSSLAELGWNISFSIFLFVAGAVFAFMFLKGRIEMNRKTKYWKRTLEILLGFYGLSFLIKFFVDRLDFMRSIYESLLFISIPEYTEFIIPFVIIGTLSLLSLDLLKKHFNKRLWVASLAILSFFIGWLVWSIQPVAMAEIPKAVFSLFFGYKNWHTFPVFQHMFVYLIGIAWGRFLLDNKGEEKSLMKEKARVSGVLTLFSGFLTSVVFVVGQLFPEGSVLAIAFSNERFPPGLMFILPSFIFIFGASMFYFVYRSMRLEDVRQKYKSVLDVFRIPLIFNSRYAFEFFLVHVFLLYLVNLFIVYKVQNLMAGLIFIVAYLVVTTTLILFKELLSRGLLWLTGKR